MSAYQFSQDICQTIIKVYMEHNILHTLFNRIGPITSISGPEA